MPRQRSSIEPELLAIQALAWTVSQEGLGDRLLTLTGLDVNGLRARAGERALLASVLSFLEGNETDLIACAAALDVKPEQLVATRITLDP